MSQEIEDFKNDNPDLYQKIIDSLAAPEESMDEEEEAPSTNERGMLGERDADGTLIAVTVEEVEEVDPEEEAPERKTDFVTDLMSAEWTEDSVKAVLSKHDKTPEEGLDLYPVTGEGSNKLASILKALTEGEDEFVDLSK